MGNDLNPQLQIVTQLEPPRSQEDTSLKTVAMGSAFSGIARYQLADPFASLASWRFIPALR